MKNLIIFYFFFLTSYVFSENIFTENWAKKEFVIPNNSTLKILDVNSYDGEVNIDCKDTVNKVLESIFGINIVAWVHSSLNDQNFYKNLRNIKPFTARLPGGSWSDGWLWDGEIHWTFKDNYQDIIVGPPRQSWTLTTDELLEICDSIGAEPQIIVNFAISRYIDSPDAVNQAAHYAAEWVRYVKKKGIKVRYWEVGNENYGKWENGYSVGGNVLTAEEYGRTFCVYADSMKKADPNIYVGAVIYPSESGSNVPNWTQTVVNLVQDKADFLISHEYFTWASDLNTIPVEEVLAAKTTIAEDMENIKKMIVENSSKTVDDLPVAMTEYNMRAGEKNTTGVATLFIAEALGEFIKSKYGLVNIWDAANSKGFDDHGLLSRGEDGVEDFTPHPSFFAYYFYRKFFGDVMVNSSSNIDKVFSYASTFSNGYIGLVLVNENSSAKNVKINVTNFNLGEKAYIYEVYYDSLTSRKIYINGETSANGELYGPRNYDEIPPYSVDINNPFIIPLKKYSVTFVVLESNKTNTIKSSNNFKDVNIIETKAIPNPFNPITNIMFLIRKGISNSVKVTVYDATGKIVKSYNLNTQKLTIKNNYIEGSIKIDGKQLNSGVYFYTISSGNYKVTKKLLLIK